MKNVFRGLLVAVAALAFACGGAPEEADEISTTSQEERSGTVLGPDFSATLTPSVDCTAGTTSISGTLSSAGSGTEAEVTVGGSLIGVITEKEFVGKSMKYAPYSFTFATATDGDYLVCFTQSGSGGRETKQTCTTVTVDCVL